jgi:hypothetical protein
MNTMTSNGAQTQAEISTGMRVILDVLQLYFCTTLIKRLVFAILVSVAMMDKKDAARLSGICEKSGRAYMKKLEKDPQTYMMIGSGGRPQKLDSVKIELLAEIDCGIYRTLREIRVKIQAIVPLPKKWTVSVFQNTPIRPRQTRRKRAPWPLGQPQGASICGAVSHRHGYDSISQPRSQRAPAAPLRAAV